MAENIQALVDLLGGSILDLDLSHIQGAEIVNGNHSHIANFLSLLLEVSVLIVEKRGGEEGETEEEGEEREPTDEEALRRRSGDEEEEDEEELEMQLRAEE